MRFAPILLGICLVSFAYGSAACGSAASSTPRARVAADLGCTVDRTEVMRLPDPEARPANAPPQATSRWQVSGCGRTAVYLCTYPVRDCWREMQ